jgi:hypothetical protein
MDSHEERVLTAYHLLLEDLRRPYDPQFCVLVLLAFVEILFAEPEWNTTTKAVVDKLDLDPVLDAFVVFACAPRTDYELEHLHKVTTCYCDSDHVQESSGGQAHVDFHRAGRLCFAEFNHQHPLHTVLHILTRPWGQYKLNWERKEPKFYRTGLQPLESRPAGLAWPQTMYQLLPHGPEDTMRGLIQWLSGWVQVHISTRMQMLIWVDALASVCYAEVIPYIITSRTLLAAVIDMLGVITANWRPDSPTEDHEELASFVTSIGRHLQTLKTGMTLAEWAAFIAPFVVDVVRCCDAAITLCKELVRKCDLPAIIEVLQEETLPWFVIWGSVAVEWHPEVRPDLGEVSDIMRRGSVLAVKERHPWFRLLVHIRILHRRRRCCAPDCRRTWADLRRPASLCRGCNRVQYCSVTCQKVCMDMSRSGYMLTTVAAHQNAWRHILLPHRSVCALLDHVCARFRLDHRTIEERMYEPTENKSFAPIGEVLVQYFDVLHTYQLETAPSGSYTVFVHASRKRLMAANIQVTAQKRHGVCAA